MKRITLITALGLAFLSTQAFAQFGSGIVYDPTQGAHAIQQIQQFDQQIQKAEQQIQKAEQIYTTALQTRNTIVSAYNLAHQLSMAPQQLYQSICDSLDQLEHGGCDQQLRKHPGSASGDKQRYQLRCRSRSGDSGTSAALPAVWKPECAEPADSSPRRVRPAISAWESCRPICRRSGPCERTRSSALPIFRSSNRRPIRAIPVSKRIWRHSSESIRPCLCSCTASRKPMRSHRLQHCSRSSTRNSSKMH